jgi:hypothetical protein
MGLVTLLTDPSSFKYYANGDQYAPYNNKGKGNVYNLRAVPWGAGTPGEAGIAGNGSNPQPLVTSSLPSLDTAQTPQTLADSLYRGQGVLTRATLQDTQRISKFLISEEGLQFLAKNQALLLSQNIRQHGNNVSQWTFINPASYVENTALAPTGINVRNTFTFGLNPTFTRESTYGEMPTYKTKKQRAIAISVRNRGLVDTITTSPLYISSSANPEYLKDTVPFYIQKINNDGSGQNTYIHFRAYISGLSDDYGADWKSTKYMGRGEEFFSYGGFSRDIGFSFQVPVLSRAEQSSVYSKLNYLASLMAPDYTQGGFMRGNLVKITIGDYITDLPGIIKGIGFDFPDEAGWDIARNDLGEREEDAYIMPKLINVKSIKFTPIHDFIPQTVGNRFIESGDGRDVNAPFISFGKTGDLATNAGGYYNTPQPKPLAAGESGPLTQAEAIASSYPGPFA